MVGRTFPIPPKRTHVNFSKNIFDVQNFKKVL
jgi:hypothetical protein